MGLVVPPTPARARDENVSPRRTRRAASSAGLGSSASTHHRGDQLAIAKQVLQVTAADAWRAGERSAANAGWGKVLLEVDGADEDTVWTSSSRDAVVIETEKGTPWKLPTGARACDDSGTSRGGEAGLVTPWNTKKCVRQFERVTGDGGRRCQR